MIYHVLDTISCLLVICFSMVYSAGVIINYVKQNIVRTATMEKQNDVMMTRISGVGGLMHWKYSEVNADKLRLFS